MLGRLAALEAGRPERRDPAAERAAYGEPLGPRTYLGHDPDGTPVVTLIAGVRLAYRVVGLDQDLL